MISWVEMMSKHDLARHLPRFDVGMMILADVKGFYTATSPNKSFDYLAAGLPVIASDVGGLPEVLDRGRAGVLVPPADADALAVAIERLLASPHEAARLTGAGHERAGHYSEATMIERIDALYHGLLAGGSR